MTNRRLNWIAGVVIAVLAVTAPAFAANTPLVASAVRTASGDSGTLPVGSHFELLTNAVFTLDVTAASSAAGDTLNVYVQHSCDEGTTWDDFVSYTQVLGNGGAKKFLAFWAMNSTAPTTPIKAPQDGALTAGNVQQGPVCDGWRVKWVIVNGGGSHSFTFSVSVKQIEQ
jgi:hypothetical protein